MGRLENQLLALLALPLSQRTNIGRHRPSPYRKAHQGPIDPQDDDNGFII
jgi:hypothetical protein